jgi:hypothetical protein
LKVLAVLDKPAIPMFAISTKGVILPATRRGELSLLRGKEQLIKLLTLEIFCLIVQGNPPTDILTSANVNLAATALLKERLRSFPEIL